MERRQGMTAGEWALLVLLSILWGGSFFFSKVIIRELPPLTLVCVRFSIAAAVLAAYLQARRTPIPRSLPTWAAFAGMGVLNNLIPAGLIAWGQETIASGLASVLIATTPVFSILVAHGLTPDEKLSINKVVGVGLGIAGTAALVGVGAVDGSGRTILAMTGCLGAALSYGFANVYGRRFKRMGVTPVVGAFGQLATTAIIALPAALLVDQPWGLPWPDREVWAAMAGLAVVSTAFGYGIFFRLLATVGTTNISLVTLLIPVSAILLGTVVLGERLSLTQFAGMAIIGLGLVAIDGRLLPTRQETRR